MPETLYFPEPEFHIQNWKRCNKCQLYKSPEEYWARNTRPNGLQPRCIECQKFDRILRLYNITEEKYIKMVKDQHSRCAICGELQEVLCIDHDHSCCPGSSNSCGVCIRQLLCHACNRVLGVVKDDITLLTSMINYVERHNNA